MERTIKLLGVVFIITLFALTLNQGSALAASADEIDRDVDVALVKLYAHSPAAAELAKTAKAVLMFPKIIKAGLVVGGKYGVGALRKGSKTAGYYRTVEASYGLQAGAQVYGYALFLMTDHALDYLAESDGFELGAGPTLVVADEGFEKAMTTTTLKDDIYAFAFGQEGLMGGLGLKGTKITKFTPDE